MGGLKLLRNFYNVGIEIANIGVEFRCYYWEGCMRRLQCDAVFTSSCVAPAPRKTVLKLAGRVIFRLHADL